MDASTPNLSGELAVAISAARAGAGVIRAHAGGLPADAIAEKQHHDLVTFVDREADHAIRRVIHAEYADAVILGEETADEGRGRPVSGRTWVVDPLDGTTNFAHDVPPYAVSIALCDDGAPILGVVFDVAHDELYTAVRGEGATVNGRPMRVSTAEDLEASLISTGFPFRDYRYMAGYLETFESVARATRGVRRHGAVSVDLAWLARGRFDGFFEAGLAPWDLAAGVLLVREAGGRVDGLPAGADPVWDGAIVASNNRIHHDLSELTRPLVASWLDRAQTRETRDRANRGT
jgi:myo-inositol-1(or 4)-monophosphatase